MRRLTKQNSTAFLAIGFLSLTVLAYGQSRPDGKDGGKDQPRERRVRIQRQVEPAFQVTPLVHRVEERRGKLIPFRYEVTAGVGGSTVIVKRVGLRQEENGVVLPDEETPPPEGMVLETPERLVLDGGETAEIRGHVRVPFNDSNFHSFGVLISDTGRKVESSSPESEDEDATHVNLKFVTRYLCRVDVTVLGVRGEGVSRLKLESAELLSVDGRPQARIYVVNPSDTPLEFQLRCRLAKPDAGSTRQFFHLVLPVRGGLDEPDRFTAKILPGSRVRLDEFVPYAVFPGEWELVAELMANFRPVASARFPVAVGEDDFPAQDATVIQVADGVSLAPGQVELSIQRGGSRLTSLLFANDSPQPVTLTVAPVSSDGQPLPWALVRPKQITVDPGRERKILVSVGPDRDESKHHYGWLAVTTEASSDREGTAERIPLALIGRSKEGPQLKVDSMQWDPTGRRPAFVIPVENTGTRHLPLRGELVLAAEDGSTVRTTAGHGVWLLPGAKDELRFELPELPKTGVYQLAIRIDSGKPDEPFVYSETIQLRE